MSSDPVPIFLYHGGIMTQDSEGYGYDGPRPYVWHANPKIRFLDLKQKIYSVTKWSESLYDLEINARFQVGWGGRFSLC